MDFVAKSFRPFAAHFSARRGSATPTPSVTAEVPRDLQVLATEEDVSLTTIEPVSGLITRELRPATDSMFTCHAFSKDAVFLVTGETNASLRLWSTSDYKCKARWTGVFQNPVSAVSSIKGDSSHVIAVDKSGRLCDFFVDLNTQDDTGQSAVIQPGFIHHEVGSDENLGDHPEALMHQFSSDGDVLISTSHETYPSGLGHTVVNVVRVADSECPRIPITLSDASTCVPILSKNGRGLLLLCPPQQESGCSSSPQEDNRCAGIWLVPELDPMPASSPSQVPGSHASWGKMGEYLLVWNTQQGAPKLEVYETKKFKSSSSRDPDPMAQTQLRHGLPRWMAKMFDEPSDDGIIEVMICESDDDVNIFSVWDIKQKAVTKEVKMMLTPGKPVVEKTLSRVKEKFLRSRTRRPPSPDTNFIESVLGNVFPEACGSVDKNWFGAVSWIHETVSLSSAGSDVTVWVSSCADELSHLPLSMPKRVMFDAVGKHVLVLGEHVIQAFAPPCMGKDFKVNRRIEELNQELTVMDAEEGLAELLDAYRCLPSAALARAWEIGVPANSRLAWFRRRNDVYWGKGVVDASLSPDNQQLALIQYDPRGYLYSTVRTSRCDASIRYIDTEQVRFPIKIEWRDHEFSPKRVFLYKNGNENCLAFVSTEECPVAVFLAISGGQKEVVRLRMTTCLRICKVEDSKVLLLDSDGVFCLSLPERKIIDRVPYRTKNFAPLLDDVRGALKWYAGHGEGIRKLPHDCGISADGHHVLLAWDVKNKRSIIVDSTTREGECRNNIQASAMNLSEFCILSPTGNFTAFLDVEDLRQGRLTIGVFCESSKRITFHVEIDRNIPEDMSSDCRQKVLADVFYGFSRDEKELVVNTIGMSVYTESNVVPETTAQARPVLPDRLNIFRIHRGTRCTPDEHLLRLAKGTIDRDLIERLRTSFGVSILNLRLAANLTMFQDAILNRKDKMKSHLMAMAKKQGVKLAVEWEESREEPLPTEQSSEGRVSLRQRVLGSVLPGTRPLPSETESTESTDLLKKALKSNETNYIQQAVHLVCSDIAPFTSSARIIKKSFPELLTHESIMKETLEGEYLLCEVGDLEVHVDFMNSKLRRGCAIHTITSDSYLEWSEIRRPEGRSALWRSKNAEAIENMESAGNKSTTKAKLVFVRIEDAAKAGMRGIIRPLLLKHAPVAVFNTEAIKTVIQYKWHSIWKRRSRHSLLRYIVFVAVFTCYAVFVVASFDNSIGYSFRDICNYSLAVVVYGFGCGMMLVEFRQALTFSRESHEYSHSFFEGLAHYFLSKWNRIDIVSSTLLSTVIPVLHFASLFGAELKRPFALITAFESILVYAKIWYYVQPFRSTGSLVVMMNSIVQACTTCLVLAFVYTVGFGLALFILFSHDERPHDSKAICRQDDSSGSEEFRNFPKSLLTLFYAFLGSFESETYHSDETFWSWMISLVFVTYLLVQSLLLLNLVLAIMGDTFDKVKLTEDAVFLHKQAQHIDAIEAELNEEKVKEVNSKVGKYVCKLVYPDGKDHDEEEGSGRMNMIETCVKKATQEWEKKLTEEIRTNAKRMEEIRREISEQSAANAKRMDEMLMKNAAQMEEIRSLLQNR